MAGTIVRAAIHPAIGIARVGSSRRGYLLAPQVPDPLPRPVNSSHDGEGELKREAVEFRIYGYDADGNVVAELTADNAEIAWTVHVANSKAAWYKFRHAMDIPTLADTVVERRNPEIVDLSERARLTIDPGRRSIAGRNQDGLAAHRFDTGTFKDMPVYLGEIRTDGRGRLLFFGGRGVSRSPGGAPSFVRADSDPFGNAADWHDDICDGPVDAVVRTGGVEIPVEGAWVVTAPPNYAPDLKSWRTLYEALVDAYVQGGWMAPKTEISFTRDIYPILARLSAMQWVNKSHAAVFGAKAPFDFTDPGLISRIGQVHGGLAVDTFKPLRTAVFKIFREQGKQASDPAAWPWLYGDAYGTAAETDPHGNLALTGERLRFLEAWRDGRFVADWGKLAPPPAAIDQVALADQPMMLDRAALDFCAADAFHPGIELTWPMRHLSLYSTPFRIRRASAPEPDYGPHLDVATALSSEGPLHGQRPGSLSRWMLLPWQVDTGGCLAGYDDDLEFDAPSFWPARVPNHVLSEENYIRATDTSIPREERIAAFSQRRSWFTPLDSFGTDWGDTLIRRFGSMGVVEARPGPEGDPDIPVVLYVESLPPQEIRPVGARAGAEAARAAVVANPAASSTQDIRAQAAGFANEADRLAVRRMRFGR